MNRLETSKRKLSFDYSNVMNFIKQSELNLMEKQCQTLTDFLVNKTGVGHSYLGWIDLPTNYDKVEFDRIKSAAEKIKNDSEVLIVIGIGGSYLGARS
ncbi:MAG: glucose-6-phosphate isomerase, partial [Peptostreptococcaceae bacterium]